MDATTLPKRLEVWKYILFMNVGACLALFLQAVLSYLETGSLLFQTSWYAAWLIVELAAFLPGFVLLWGKHWMQVPLPERLNTVFGYFVVTWFNLLPVGIRVGAYEPKSFNFFLLGCAIAIVMGYRFLRRKSLEGQDEIFP
jgi:hypothetical protein